MKIVRFTLTFRTVNPLQIEHAVKMWESFTEFARVGRSTYRVQHTVETPDDAPITNPVLSAQIQITEILADFTTFESVAVTIDTLSGGKF
jgi:hypothetical protein